MGAKTWMLVLAARNARDAFAARPSLIPEASQRLAGLLFPREKLKPLGETDLSYTCPPKHELHIGCFAGVSVVAAQEFGADYPSKLPSRFVDAAGDGRAVLHAMHSAVDWFAFAIWERGKLVRSLSLSPEHGIIEDIGERLPFEAPFWAGEFPVETDEDEQAYPLPFHPLELGEAALKDQFGYQLEGIEDSSLLEPWSIPLLRFRRIRSAWWKFW